MTDTKPVTEYEVQWIRNHVRSLRALADKLEGEFLPDARRIHHEEFCVDLVDKHAGGTVHYAGFRRGVVKTVRELMRKLFALTHRDTDVEALLETYEVVLGSDQTLVLQLDQTLNDSQTIAICDHFLVRPKETP